MILTGDKEFYKGIGAITFEGKESDNPLSFKYYDPERKVMGKTMREHFKFAVAYWHSFCGKGGDPFGPGTQIFPWDKSSDPMKRAHDKADAAFEFITKMGFDYFCFHDVDLVDESESLSKNEKQLHEIGNYIAQKQKDSNVKLLWGTANCFSNPVYMNGAATNPDFKVVARAGAQIKMALDLTISLGGENYVFWGGREGYMSLLNTDMSRELNHMGQMLSMARDYARAQGFKGSFFIEPKHMEPMKHQYDFDAATAIGFLREYKLDSDFKLNIEVNHATLAQHSFEHELTVAANAEMLGSIDANRGDNQNGWDTDQFPVNLYEVTEAMLVLLQNGGLKGGGVNFDAKIRRNSTDFDDIFHAHIGGVDTFARALITAEKILISSEYSSLRKNRYASFDTGNGNQFEKGSLTLEALSKIAFNDSPPKRTSGKQELFENIINQFI